MRMRLKKVKQVVKKVFGVDLRLHITTEMRDDVVAYEQWWDDQLEMLVNGNVVKNDEALVVAVAHGLAHKFVGSNKHDDRFFRMEKEVLEVLVKEMKLDMSKVREERDELYRIADISFKNVETQQQITKQRRC